MTPRINVQAALWKNSKDHEAMTHETFRGAFKYVFNAQQKQLPQLVSFSDCY